VWAVIFKTASAPASQHVLRSPFPSFPPIEQSRCSIPPFERCKATRRSLLEHLVDRSTTLLSSSSHGSRLISCALLLLFASLSKRGPGISPQPFNLSSFYLYYCLCPKIPPGSFGLSPVSSPCAAFICSCEDKGNKSGHPPELIPFRPCDRLTLRQPPSLLFILSLPGLGSRSNDVCTSLGAARC
jgi:hypothetical protein